MHQVLKLPESVRVFILNWMSSFARGVDVSGCSQFEYVLIKAMKDKACRDDAYYSFVKGLNANRIPWGVERTVRVFNAAYAF